MWRKFLLKYRIYIVLICLLLIFTVILSFTSRKKELTIGKSSFILEMIYPWQKLTLSISNKLNYTWQSTVYFFYLKKDNEKLNKELANLKKQNNELLELTKENERLKILLGYKKKTSYKLKLAMVVGRDVNNYFNIITIDLGERDDIKNNMPIITSSAVVGKIVNISSEISQVMLITDYNSSISGMVQGTRCVGSVIGSGKDICKMKYLSINDNVKPGDIVITSGDGIFPKGLIIGEIVKVSNASDNMSLDIDIKPAVNVLKLEEVFIVMKD